MRAPYLSTKSGRAAMAATMLLAVVSGVPAAWAQKADRLPVDVKYVMPAEMKRGEVGRTVVVLKARTDIETLRVDVYPLDGVAFVAGDRETTFSDLKAGDVRETVFEIRLDADGGDVQLRFRSVAGGHTGARIQRLRYGAPDTSASEGIGR